MSKEEKIKKIDGKGQTYQATKHLYDNAVNDTNRIQNYPKTNDKILEPVKIALINIGKDMVRRNAFIRVSFIGNPQKFYEYPLNSNESYNRWVSIVGGLEFDKDLDIDFGNDDNIKW